MSAEARAWSKKRVVRMVEFIDGAWKVFDRNDATAKNVLRELADFADADGKAWPKVTTLAEVTGLKERAVQQALRRLEAAGHIIRTGQMAPFNRNIPVYRLPLEQGPETQKGAADAPFEGAPDAPQGVQQMHPMGAPDAPPSRTTTEPESADALSTGGRAASPFELVRSIYPASGLKRTNWPLAAEAWGPAAMEVGEVRLLAAVTAFAADPDCRKGDYGAPGLHRWLAEKRYRAFLPAASAGPMGAGAASPGFPGPPDLRAGFVAAFDEARAASWLDRCGWDGEAHALQPATRTAADWLTRNAAAWLKSNGLAVRAPGDRNERAA
ncbi:MAG TPA: helix-turn-helix domain-containing protein [Caulobacteraceae bacterium]|jgi:hypothetical protein|nr:helix-turn-helix domain-containing protein [Caulobacteraceae bacterium]